MPKRKIDFDTVREIGLAFPGVEESTVYGFPALKMKGQVVAGLPGNKSAEPDSLGVRIPFDDRAELLRAAPDVYYITPHYAPHEVVLVRFSRINRSALRDLLGMAYKFVAAKIKRRGESKRTVIKL